MSLTRQFNFVLVGAAFLFIAAIVLGAF